MADAIGSRVHPRAIFANSARRAAAAESACDTSACKRKDSVPPDPSQARTAGPLRGHPLSAAAPDDEWGDTSAAVPSRSKLGAA